MSQPAADRKDSIAESVAGSNVSDTEFAGNRDAASPGGNNLDNKSKNEAFLDALEDVHTRFILNLPESELKSADRILFQLEQAWWFYEDWICDPDPNCSLPRFPNFKPFALQMFKYSPLLPGPSQFPAMWQQFGDYKRKISNYGCILLSQDCRRVVLCQLWKSNTRTFPSGKINQGEDGLAAAARETYEETGFDPLCVYGTTAQWREADPARVTWAAPTDADAISYQEADGGKRRTCYVTCGVPEDFPFAPVARKEVSRVQWFELDNLPPRTYAVMPFMGQLKRWVNRRYPGRYPRNKKRDSTPNDGRKDDKTPTRDRSRRGGDSRNSSRSKVQSRDDLVESGLANVGDSSGWSEEDMFRVNERLLGRKIEYDGNPQVFAEQGFAGEDPHAFRIVGGSFLNSAGGVAPLAPATDQSRLQPLFHSGADDTDADALQPFFSDDGTTPWGDVVPEVTGKGASTKSAKNKQRKQKPSKPSNASTGKAFGAPVAAQGQLEEEDDDEAIFLTDADITARSQLQKAPRDDHGIAQKAKYTDDMEFIRQWVANLPRPKPKHFGEFKLDADKIMAVAMASLKRDK